MKAEMARKLTKDSLYNIEKIEELKYTDFINSEYFETVLMGSFNIIEDNCQRGYTSCRLPFIEELKLNLNHTKIKYTHKYFNSLGYDFIDIDVISWYKEE